MEFFRIVYSLLEQYGELFLRGTGYTILLAIVGTIAGLLIGILVGMYRVIPIENQKKVFLRGIYKLGRFLTTCYIEVFRSTPMMVQAMVIFFGVGWFTGVRLNPMLTGLAIISINTGAYMAEIVRGGIISIDKGQYEAAHSVGLTHWQTMKGIVMPQALRNIMPPVGNEFVINMKDSCMLSVISVTELFVSTKTVAGATYQNFPAYFIAGVIYLVLCLVTTKILHKVENWMDGPDSYEMYEEPNVSTETV